MQKINLFRFKISDLSSAKALTVLMIFCLFSQHSKAIDQGPTAYETALLIPWKFIEQSINPQAGFATSTYQNTFDNIGYNFQGVPIVLPQAQLETLVHLKPVQTQMNETVWETDQLAFRFKVAPFKVQKDIDQYISGVHAIVRLRAECSSFVMVQPKAHAQLAWRWSVNGAQINADLKSISLDWEPNSWQIGDIFCKGPVGFADVIQTEMRQQLAQPDSMAAIIKSALQKSLNDQMNAWLQIWKKPQWFNQNGQPFNIELTNSSIINEEGFLLKGLLRFGEPLTTEKIISLSNIDSTLFKNLNSPSLIVSTSAVQNAIQMKSIQAQSTMTLNSESGFQRLLKSRFLQFFIWQDLMHFAKSATFNLVSKLISAPKIQFSSGLNAQLEGTVSSTVKAPRDGQVLNYVRIETAVKSLAHFAITNGQFLFQLDSPQLKMTAEYDPEYLKKYRPSSQLPVSLLQKSLEQGTTFKSSSWLLPLLKLSDSFSLQADSLKKLDQENFLIEFKRN